MPFQALKVIFKSHSSSFKKLTVFLIFFNADRREIYFIAIIDVLTQYGVKKQVSFIQYTNIPSFFLICTSILRPPKQQKL